MEPLVISSKESLTLIDMIKKIQERFKKITSLDSKTVKKSEKEEALNAELVLKSDFIIDENFLNLELDNLINYCLNNFTNSASRSHE